MEIENNTNIENSTNFENIPISDASTNPETPPTVEVKVELEKFISTESASNSETTVEKNQNQPKSLIISEENKQELNTRFDEIFSEKLSILFSKFTNDIELMESIKYTFSDYFYELEQIKNEINELTSKDHSNYSTVKHTEVHHVLTTSANVNTKKGNNELIRSKTPSKLNLIMHIDTKESQNHRVLNTERSKTPLKTIAKPKNDKLNLKNNTLHENSKTPAKDNNAKPKKTLLDNKPDVSRAKINTVAVQKVPNPKISSGTVKTDMNANKKTTMLSATTKRDLTPIIKKNVQNLDTSLISFDNSMKEDSKKGNMTQKNRGAKIIEFSKSNTKNLNNSVLEKHPAPSKKVLNTNKQASNKDTSKFNVTNDKNADKKEKGKIAKNPESHEENEIEKNESVLKKDDSVTNIMDIIAAKNKEVNIEEIMNEDKGPEIKNKEDEEECKENKIEEEKNKTINDEISLSNEISEIKLISDEKQEEGIKNDSNVLEIKNKENLVQNIFKDIPDYENKKNKPLHYLIVSKFLPIKDNISILFSNKEIFNNKELFKYLKNEYINDLKGKINEYNSIIQKYSSDSACESILNKQYELSKTALGSLNLLKKEDENLSSLNKEQNEYYLDLFEFFLILLTNDFDKYKRENLISEINEKIYPKLKIDGHKNMVLYLNRNLNLSRKQFDSIIEFMGKHPHIIDSKSYINISRNLTSMTFSAKEIYEYLKLKLPDETYAYYVKIAFNQLNKCSEILSKMEKK